PCPRAGPTRRAAGPPLRPQRVRRGRVPRTMAAQVPRRFIFGCAGRALLEQGERIALAVLEEGHPLLGARVRVDEDHMRLVCALDAAPPELIPRRLDGVNSEVED